MCGHACSTFVKKRNAKHTIRTPPILRYRVNAGRQSMQPFPCQTLQQCPASATPHSLLEVVIPILHLDLGTFPWIYDALCKDVYQLDVALAQSSAALHQAGDRSQFQALISAHQSVEDARRLHERAETAANDVLTHLQYLLLHTPPNTTENINQAVAIIIHAQRREKQGEAASSATSYDEQKKNWEELRAKYDKDGGPCLASLESTLQQHNIKRQAYHSGAFVGNHALQPDVTTALTSALLQVIQARTSGAEQQAEATARLVEKATTVKLRYQKLFSQYAI